MTLREALENDRDLVQRYFTIERKIFRDWDLISGLEKPLERPSNPHQTGFRDLEVLVTELMTLRTIRGWHYTRLTDSEVLEMRFNGIHLSTPETLRSRLNGVVTAGWLTAQQAEEIHSESRLHNPAERRSNMFWLVSHPQAIDDDGVQPLLGHWGGEVAYMHLAARALISSIGKPRVVELAVPLTKTPGRGHRAACAVIDAFSRSLGCSGSGLDFDFFVNEPLRPDAIVRIHTEGDQHFHAIGRDYPEGYADLERQVWKEFNDED